MNDNVAMTLDFFFLTLVSSCMAYLDFGRFEAILASDSWKTLLEALIICDSVYHLQRPCLSLARTIHLMIYHEVYHVTKPGTGHGVSHEVVIIPMIRPSPGHSGYERYILTR